MLALQEEELTRKVGLAHPPALPGCRPSLSGGSSWCAAQTHQDPFPPKPHSSPQQKREQRSPHPLLRMLIPPSHTQIQPSDALEPEFPKKYQSLLRCWREKVFVLMVQLKAQDLEHKNSMKGLRDQVRGSVSHQSALSISHNDDSFALGGRHVLGTGPEETPACSPGASVLKE